MQIGLTRLTIFINKRIFKCDQNILKSFVLIIDLNVYKTQILDQLKQQYIEQHINSFRNINCSKMSNDLFMRDDIIQFSTKLDAECFNVKAYRMHKSKSKKASLLAAMTTDLGFSQENILKSNNSIDKKKEFSREGSSQKRISLTANLKRRADISQNLKSLNKSLNIRQQLASHKIQPAGEEVKTAKINFHNKNSHAKSKSFWGIGDEQLTGRLKLQEGSKQQYSGEQIMSKYKQLQQKYHKAGPINDRAIQNWLNQILTEYCHQQQFDKSIENSALKKMSMDRNSLLSQGINPEYVNRVYKSMFVYSIGFNNLLKELSGKNSSLKKTIWKVYAILLQFCSQGTFETMIGEIERDKARKVQSLRQEIQKRQKIIQNNDEINQEKNAKIYKELKILRQQNASLQNEKNVLIEDFKQAQQSFNQQVSMRLKFQNKINQIHGIHHELSTKHARLYDDYHKKVNQIELLEKNYKEIAQNYLVAKEKLARTLDELEEKKRHNKSMQQLVLTYQHMRTTFENSQIQMKNSKQDLHNLIDEKLRRISQLQVELQNNDIMLTLTKSSSKQLQAHYREQLQQNKKLHATIREQITQLNELFTQKKGFNDKHMQYVAEIQFLKNKDSQNKFIIEKMKREMKQLVEANQSIQVQKIAIEKKAIILQDTLGECYENIQKMKKTKNIYEEELGYLKKKAESHGEVVRDKDLLIATLTRSNQKLARQNQQMLTINKTLDSKATVLAQRLKSQEEINRKKYQKMKEQRDQLFKENSVHNSILQEKITQLQKYMQLYDKEMLNLKNQRFERVNLDLRYKQSLQVMESQNQHIKKLNIVISQNHQEIQQWKRKFRNFQYVLKEKEHLFEVQRTSIKMHLDQARKEVQRRKMFVNPMLLEDMRGLLRRAIEKYDNLLKEHEHMITQHNKQLSNLNNKLHHQQLTHSHQLHQQQIKSQKAVQQKQSQLQYQKQKSKHLQYKMAEYEKIINQNNLQNENPNSYKQKQRKYLNTIKDKSDQIEKLLKQLETAHDQNNTLLKRISQIQHIIAHKNNQIDQLHRNITQITHQLQLIDNHNKQPYKHKDTITSKMDDYDDNLLPAMNHQPHTTAPTSAFHRQSLHKFTNATSHINNQNSQQSIRKLLNKDRNQSKSREQTLIGTTGNKSKEKQRSQRLVNPVWRNDFGKKLKNAVNYYQK